MGLFDFFKKKAAPEADQSKGPSVVYSHADYNQIIYGTIVEGAPITRLDIGNVVLPSGQIVVCDPLAYPDMPPFTRTVTPGHYPVSLYFASLEMWGKRVAIAVMNFTDKKADAFELAVKGDEDVTTLPEQDGDFFGFPVDAGLAGFMDAKVSEYYNGFLRGVWSKNPNFNTYTDLFEAEFEKNAGSNGRGDWINYCFPDKPEYNLTMFSSGFGDGLYPAYWGVKDNGEIVNLVIDFHVLLLPDDEEE